MIDVYISNMECLFQLEVSQLFNNQNIVLIIVIVTVSF